MQKDATPSGLSFWQRYARVYDTFMGKDRKAYDVMAHEIRSVLSPDREVLELACGTGLVSRRIAPACKHLIATDYSPQMIKRAQRKVQAPNLTFEEADIYDLPYDAARFDAVVISNGLHIIPDPVLALSHIRHVLKQDGLLIAPTFMHDDSPSNQIFRKPMELLGFTSYSMWTPDEYHRFFADNGWKVHKNVIIPASFTIDVVIAS